MDTLWDRPMRIAFIATLKTSSPVSKSQEIGLWILWVWVEFCNNASVARIIYPQSWIWMLNWKMLSRSKKLPPFLESNLEISRYLSRSMILSKSVTIGIISVWCLKMRTGQGRLWSSVAPRIAVASSVASSDSDPRSREQQQQQQRFNVSVSIQFSRFFSWSGHYERSGWFQRKTVKPF